ncbi:MAG: DUF4920 domain-containing protein [Bacteroidetes bacterium]|nr:DUF4920 domain-containing protein [Bacteroidota bacterium]
MKTTILLLALLFSLPVFAQVQKAPVHGQVFGSKPDTAGVMDASRLAQFMDGKARVSVAIRGKISKVTKEKGGWFTLDAGKGQVIAAHFKNYNVTIPFSLAGRTVILDGVAAKQFVADDRQHLAGNAQTGKESSKRKRISFEVSGLYVDR